MFHSQPALYDQVPLHLISSPVERETTDLPSYLFCLSCPGKQVCVFGGLGFGFLVWLAVWVFFI